jgi:hypothetical protein
MERREEPILFFNSFLRLFKLSYNSAQHCMGMQFQHLSDQVSNTGTAGVDKCQLHAIFFPCTATLPFEAVQVMLLQQ